MNYRISVIQRFFDILGEISAGSVVQEPSLCALSSVGPTSDVNPGATFRLLVLEKIDAPSFLEIRW